MSNNFTHQTNLSSSITIKQLKKPSKFKNFEGKLYLF